MPGRRVLLVWLLLLMGLPAYAQPTPYVWDRPSVSELPPGPDADLIRTGLEVFTRTSAFLGPFADGAGAGYAGNNLACGNCHIDAGRRKFAFLLIGAANAYPKALQPGGPVVSLDERLNQCMTRSMAGRPVPTDLPAFQALRAYVAFLSASIPKGAVIDGAGRVPIADPPAPADAGRGAGIFTAHCSACHRPDGLGARRGPARAAFGYAFPPLWGPDSFAASAGLADLRTLAGFIHANMPGGVEWTHPRLNVQQSYDVARFVLDHPRPRGIGDPRDHLAVTP